MVPQRDLVILTTAWQREARRLEAQSGQLSRSARQRSIELSARATTLRRCADAVERLCTGAAPLALALLGVVGEDPAP